MRGPRRVAWLVGRGEAATPPHPALRATFSREGRREVSYRPVNFAGRRSRNEATPSLWSSDLKHS
jgi:hypothetical protein